MGGKSSGWLSDCSLMVDEFLFLDRTVKGGNIELARQFVGLNRYRDDCSALNIDNFIELAKDIYPLSLELTQENGDLSRATVLDMQVDIIDASFNTKVYNKTDSFPFEVVSLPFLNSNISEKICYKVFYSQVLRYQRLCSKREDFETRVKSLGEILIKRDYKRDLLCREFLKVIYNYRGEFERWEIPSNGKLWFKMILTQPPDNHLTTRPLENISTTYFSQPHSERIGDRVNFFSQ